MFSSIAALARRLGTTTPFGRQRGVDKGSELGDFMVQEPWKTAKWRHVKIQVNLKVKPFWSSTMKIGELAAATGIAASAIRFYEQSGLLPAAQRAGNGYRSYSTEAVERLRYIQLAQALGFTLDTLRAGLVNRGALSQTQMHDDMLQRLDTRLVEVDHMLATLRAQRKDLLAVRERLLASWAEGECLDPASVQLRTGEPPAPAPAPARRVTRAPVRAPAPTPARRASRR
jgi:DNA-binding transcriptional MerR regulator